MWWLSPFQLEIISSCSLPLGGTSLSVGSCSYEGGSSMGFTRILCTICLLAVSRIGMRRLSNSSNHIDFSFQGSRRGHGLRCDGLQWFEPTQISVGLDRQQCLAHGCCVGGPSTADPCQIDPVEHCRRRRGIGTVTQLWPPDGSDSVQPRHRTSGAQAISSLAAISRFASSVVKSG